MSEIRDVSRAVGDVLRSQSHHEPVRNRYTPMRGQAYVQMVETKSDVLVLLDEDPRQQKSHRGRVLALGPPGRLTDDPNSPIVPWDFEVGDEVVFVLAVWLDKMRVLEMMGVKGHVAVVAQREIMGVYDGS